MAAMQDTFVPLGYARGKAMDLAKAVTTLAVDMASFNNTVDEEVLRGLQSALVGNHETVRRYGVIITQATLNQELLNMGIADGVKNATNQQKVMARLNIIMKGTTDAQGDAIRTSGSYANQVKRLHANFTSLLTILGEHLIPKVTEWIKNINANVKSIEEWIRVNKETIITYIKLAATIATVGVAMVAFQKIVALAMFALTPAGALGLAVAGIIALLDALGVVNIGFMSFLQNIRVGGFKMSTWIKAAWLEMFQGWERVKGHLAESWDDLVTTARTFAGALFRAIIWVPEKVLEGFDWMIRQVVSKLNWLIDKINKIPYVDVAKRLPTDIAKGAADYFKNLSKSSADASDAEWAKFEVRRRRRAKDTQAVIESLHDAQQRMFSKDIAGMKKVVGVAKAAGAPAAAAPMPTAAPAVPMVPEGPDRSIVGTFRGRRAAAMAGAGTLERESLNVEKVMARLLAVIADNTREGGMVLT